MLSLKRELNMSKEIVNILEDCLTKIKTDKRSFHKDYRKYQEIKKMFLLEMF